MIDFSNCEYSDRHGSYGGMAGDKDGIIYNGEYWLIKYPKSTKCMQGNLGMSYVASPLSEYIGSHIYGLLGYDVHETALGIRNGKLVVGCRDFCKSRGSLLEFRTIKNAANQELGEQLEDVFCVLSAREQVNLGELLLHLDHNPILQKVHNVKERFWECVVIDILINNNDRNNGNWGVLYNETIKEYQLAPVYDNGNAFSSKASDEKLRRKLAENDECQHLTTKTSYSFEGRILSAKSMLNLDNPDLEVAIEKVVSSMELNLSKIEQFFDGIPEVYSGIPVCSTERKQFYFDGFITRYNKLLAPRYAQICNKEDQFMNLF